jgi:hypothetical protein
MNRKVNYDYNCQRINALLLVTAEVPNKNFLFGE